MHAGVEVRQQAGLLQHRDRAGAHVLQRGVVAAGLQPLARGGPALLRPVAEGEQRLLAALRRARAGDLQHLVALEERGGQPVRHGGERAVVAAVAAQPGERDEDLARVRDDARAARVDAARRRGRGRPTASSSSSCSPRAASRTAASVTSSAAPSRARRSARRRAAAEGAGDRLQGPCSPHYVANGRSAPSQVSRPDISDADARTPWAPPGGGGIPQRRHPRTRASSRSTSRWHAPPSSGQ